MKQIPEGRSLTSTQADLMFYFFNQVTIKTVYQQSPKWLPKFRKTIIIHRILHLYFHSGREVMCRPT